MRAAKYCVLIATFAAAVQAHAGTLSLVGTGAGSLRHGVGGLYDITDINNNNVVDTLVWGAGPTGNPNTVGTFNGPGNNGEKWSKIFDNAIGGAGPWGTGTSKVCCSFTATSPGTFVRIDSSAYSYTIGNFTVTNGNDSSPSRDPFNWTLQGSNDGFATWTVLDTVAGHSWGGTNRVFQSNGLDNASGSYRSFRMQFTATGGGFHLGELELLSSRAEVAFDNNVAAATVGDSALFGGTLVFEFDSNSSDVLIGPSTFNLNGAVAELEFLDGLPSAGTYTLLDAATLTGALSNIIVPTQFADFVDTSNLALNGTVTITPEPASIALWSLIGAAAMVFGWRQCRRKR